MEGYTKGCKGQAATEYLMIMGISLAILIPLFAFVQDYTYRSKIDMRVNSLEDSLQSLADTSDMVYYQGYPAKITVNIYMPEGVVETDISQRTLSATLQTPSGKNDILAVTDAPVNGSLPVEAGGYKMEVRALEEGYVNISY